MVTDFRSWQLTENAGAAPAPTPVDGLYLPARVAALAGEHPDAVAVETPAGRLTYGQLSERARAVTGWLRPQGGGSGVRAAVLADKVPLVYPALLGILGAGAAFVPLDPGAPFDRNRALVERAKASVLVAGAEWAAELGDLVDRVLLVDDPLPFQRGRVMEVAALPPIETSWHGGKDDLAYVIFTSGSSGIPKGVEVERRSLDAFAAAISALVGAGPGDRVTQSARLSFDASLQQILSAFATGATLVPVPDEVRGDAEAMISWLRRQRITHWDSVPSLWAPVVGSLRGGTGGLPDLRVVILAGEAPRAADLADWLAAVPQCRLWNVYGPTEATVDATAYEVTAQIGDEPVPIGRPLPGVGAHVLDALGRPCEPYVEGEIHLEGDCLARGYLDDVSATAAAFVQLSLDGGPPRRLYRTGDLGYRMSDGVLVCTGRRDRQLKINGVRIEPAEVETALLRAPEVREAAVTVSTAGRLVAVVAGSPALDVERLRESIARQLPAAMIPSAVVAAPALPRSASGKVALRALRDLVDLPATPRSGPATTELQRVIQEACRVVLRRDVGLHDDLFAAGLDSISGLRLRAELAGRGVRLPATDIFARPSVAALSEAAGSLGGPETAVPTAPEAGPVTVPLLPSQRSVLASVLAGTAGRLTGLVQEAHHYTDRMNPDRLAAAAAELLRRHDALRCAIVTDYGGAEQHVAAAGSVTLTPRHHETTADGHAALCQQIADDDLRKGFEIAVAPLLRLSAVHSPAGTTLIWTMHHLVTDGWSWELVNRDFTAGYQGLPPGPPGPSLVRLARRPVRRPEPAELRPLLDDLTGTVAAELPRGGGDRSRHGRSGGKQTRLGPLPPISGTETRTSGVVLWALGAALSRLTAQPDIALGLVTSGRFAGPPGIERSVAALARVTPVSWRSGSSTKAGCQEQIERALAFEAYDLDTALAEAGVPIGVRTPRITLLVQNYASGLPYDDAAEALGLDPERSWSRETSPSDLAVVVHTAATGLAARLEFWPSRVDPGAVQRLLREFQRELHREAIDRDR